MEYRSDTEHSTSETLSVPTMAELAAEGKEPEILFWVGCAGSFDERAQKITRDICKILQPCRYKLCRFRY